MKLIITICFGILYVVAAMEQETYQLPPQKVQSALKFSTTCAEEYNLDPATILNKVADGTLPRDDIHAKYIHCFGLKTGFVDDTGHFVVPKIAGLLEGHPRLEEFTESIKKCNELTKENPVATVVEMNICFTSTAPIKLLV